MKRFNEKLYGSRSATHRNRVGAIAFGTLAAVTGLALVLMGTGGGWAAVGIGAAAILIVTLLPAALGEKPHR
ncbi:hypothetical protein [Streptomyces chilikensis]|uniref:hypothetical protein n=1 Tax=Streptomyces chilikensis TaxID=1194079 RepID=UPI000AAC2F2B|nr:hypothetical protein [Streptomyces chilikensis]